MQAPGGRIGGSKKPKPKASGGKDAMRGRTDKMGTLLGFNDPFQKLTPLDYGVVALSRCSLLSISRAELKALLTTYEDDKEYFLGAINIANQTIQGGARRSSTRLATNINPAALAAAMGEASNRSGAATPPAERKGSEAFATKNPLLGLQSPATPTATGGEKDSEIAELKQEVATLRSEMAALLQSQNVLLEKLAKNSGLQA